MPSGCPLIASGLPQRLLTTTGRVTAEAHRLRPTDTCASRLSTPFEQLATEEAKHERRRKTIPLLALPTAIVQLASVVAPASAHSESLGGLYRRVRPRGARDGARDGARPRSPTAPLHHSELEFVPVLYKHPVSAAEGEAAEEAEEAEGAEEEEEEEEEGKEGGLEDGGDGGEGRAAPPRAPRKPKEAFVRLYYPIETFSQRVYASDVCRHVEVRFDTPLGGPLVALTARSRTVGRFDCPLVALSARCPGHPLRTV